jgi:hypothetical protein
LNFDLQLFKAAGKPGKPRGGDRKDSSGENRRDYVCSTCGASAYYDGRMGDGPILMCGCGRPIPQWDDRAP